MSFDEECLHQYNWFGKPVSSWYRYPPVIGKMFICGRCGAIHAGMHSVTAAGNYIDMTTASAPGNPASGLVRIYSDTSTTMQMKDENGNVTALVGGSSALALAGSQATEGTTTSASEVDLLSLGSLSIGVTIPIWIWFILRASSTTGPTFGLKLNSTQVTTAFNATYEGAAGSSVNMIYVGPRVDGTLRAIVGFALQGKAGADGNIRKWSASAADMPTATITDVVITADSNGSETAGADELRVYTLATS